MKKLISLVIIITCISTVQAQYVADALRFSQNFPTLSARSLSMGGAFTSLGGDFSSTLINPAGLGLYRKSEFVFSPGLGYSKTKADYLGETNDDFKYQFIMSNLGYVGTYNSNKDKGLVSASYAIGYNRLNNFNSNMVINGTNELSSYSDQFVEFSNGFVPDDLYRDDPFGSALFYDAYVIDNPEFSDAYVSLVPVPIEQNRFITTQGGIGQLSFSAALNFSNVLYFGLGLGVNRLNYEYESVHTEINHDNNLIFRMFEYTEELDIEGVGFAFNFGLIARLGKYVRVGSSLALPTFYKIDEEYFSSVYNEFADSSFNSLPTDVNGDGIGAGIFEYALNTPLRWNTGASFQIGKSGIISVDAEYVGYTLMKMRTVSDFNTSVDRNTINNTNDQIDQTYRPVINLKAGGELRFGNHFSVRAGGGYYPSPYSSDELNSDAYYTEITSGVGYRNNSFFFDLGFSGLFHKEEYNLYTSNNFANIASLKQPKYRFIASVGFRF